METPHLKKEPSFSRLTRVRGWGGRAGREGKEKSLLVLKGWTFPESLNRHRGNVWAPTRTKLYPDQTPLVCSRRHGHQAQGPRK